jgi:hypothetical protein
VQLLNTDCIQCLLHFSLGLCVPRFCSIMSALQVRHHEGTFADLRAAGAPAEGPAYADAGEKIGTIAASIR